MNNPELYNMIFRRRSVRKYKPEPLGQEALSDLEEFVAGIPPLAAGVDIPIRFFNREEVRRGIPAPQFAVIYAGAGKKAILSAGYRMEMLALYIASKGLGCCYNGVAKPIGEAAAFDGIMPAIMPMAVGVPAEPALRASVGEFKRNKLSDIALPSVPTTIAEAVRLAPSGMNVQPWLLRGDAGAIELVGNPGAFFRVSSRMLGYDYNFDMGIALAHLHLAAIRQGYSCSFDFDAAPKVPLAKHQQLCCRVELH